MVFLRWAKFREIKIISKLELELGGRLYEFHERARGKQLLLFQLFRDNAVPSVKTRQDFQQYRNLIFSDICWPAISPKAVLFCDFSTPNQTRVRKIPGKTDPRTVIVVLRCHYSFFFVASRAENNNKICARENNKKCDSARRAMKNELWSSFLLGRPPGVSSAERGRWNFLIGFSSFCFSTNKDTHTHTHSILNLHATTTWCGE